MLRTHEKHRMLFIFLLATIYVLVFGGSVYSAAKGSEQIDISVAIYVPKTYIWAEAFADFMGRVTERTQGRVKFKPYYAEALIKVKDSLTAARDGIVDITMGATAYTTDVLPLNSGMLSLTFITHQADTLSKAYNELLRTEKDLQAEFDKYRVKHIASMPPGESVLLSKVPIKTVADLKGLKIRAVAGDMKPIQAAGAAPVPVPMNEIYDAIAKGVLDANSTGAISIMVTLGIHRIAPYITEMGIGQLAFLQTVMNLDKWNSLPEDVKKIMEEELENMISDGVLKLNNIQKTAFYKALAEGAHMDLFPPEERRKMREMGAPLVWNAWVQGKARRQELLDKLLALVDKYKAKSKYIGYVELFEEWQKKNK